MTIEEKKKYLSTYRLKQTKINRLGELMVTYPESREEYKARLQDIVDERDTMEKEMAEVLDPLLSEILVLKYQCGKTIEEISYSINYSRRHTERLFLKALGEFKAKNENLILN